MPIDKPGSSRPMPLSELMRLEAELAARAAPIPGKVHPRPHPCLPEVLAPGSNVAYVSLEENARLVRQALVLNMGRFRAL